MEGMVDKGEDNAEHIRHSKWVTMWEDRHHCVFNDIYAFRSAFELIYEIVNEMIIFATFSDIAI